jgi:hypothetical protein
MKTLISPSFTEDKLRTGNVQDLVDVHEDRVRGWILKPARVLLPDPDSAFAVLSIVLPYFESHAIFCKGEESHNKSIAFFVDSFCEVFGEEVPCPADQEVPMPANFKRLLGRKIYDLARCGLFHRGMTRHGLAVGKIDEPIYALFEATPVERATGVDEYVVEIEGAIINPERFVGAIDDHFQKYVRALRDPNNRGAHERLIRGWNLTRPEKLVEFPPLPM